MTEAQGGRAYYVATVERARTALRAEYCRFVAQDTHDLAVMRAHAIEVYAIGPGGSLQPHPRLGSGWRLPVRGRLTEMRAVRLPGAATDALIVTTEKETGMVLRVAGGSIVVQRQLDLHERLCRPIERGLILAVQSAAEETQGGDSAAKRARTGPQGSGRAFAAVHAAQGLIKIVDLASGAVRNERIDELYVLDIAFVPPESPADVGQLAVLSSDTNGSFMYVYSMARGAVQRSMFDSYMADEGSYRLVGVPQPWGGLLVLARESIVYTNPTRKARVILAVSAMRVSSALPLDAGAQGDALCRVLLLDEDGGVHVLLLLSEASSAGRRVTSMRLERLGATVSSMCAAYLDAGVVFVGAAHAHERRVRLSSVRLPDGCFVQDLGWPHAGCPRGLDCGVLDAFAVDADGRGQAATVFAAVGSGREGGLHVARRGASFVPAAEHDLGALGARVFAAGDALYASSPCGTRALCVQDGCLEDAGDSRLASPASESILVCESDAGVVQVTSGGVFCGTNRWTPPSGKCATLAAAHGGLVAVACTDSQVHIISADGCSAVDVLSLPGEASALAMAPLGRHVAVLAACWTSPDVLMATLVAGRVSSADRVLSVPPGDVAVSLALARFGHAPHVLAGLGSGGVIHGRACPSASPADAQRHTQIGGAPVALLRAGRGVLVALAERAHVVAACPRRPGEPGDAARRVTYSVVDVSGVCGVLPVPPRLVQSADAMADDSGAANGSSFKSPTMAVAELSISPHSKRVAGTKGKAHASPGRKRNNASRKSDMRDSSGSESDESSGDDGQPVPCVFVTDSGLLAGTLDAVADRIHHDRVSVGWTVSAIACIERYRAIVSAQVSHDSAASRVVLYDLDTLAELGSHVLPRDERAHSVCAVDVGDGSTIAVAGTSVTDPSDPQTEPEEGRLLSFDVSSRTLSLLSAQPVAGTVYSMCSGEPGRLVATVYGTACLFSWRPGSAPEWVLADTRQGLVMGVNSAARGQAVVVADIMRSLTLLRVSGDRLVEVAKDYSVEYATDVALLDEAGRAACGDSIGNLLVLEPRPDPHFASAPDAPPSRTVLAPAAGIHLGEVVTRIAPLPRSPCPALADAHVITTANGALLVFGALADAGPADVLARIVAGMAAQGGPGDADWRGLATERRTKRAEDPPRILDGDALAEFAAMEPQARAAVARAAGLDDDLVRQALDHIAELSNILL